MAGKDTPWYNSDPGNVIDIDFGWVANSPLDYAQYRIGGGSWINIFTADQSSDYTANWGISWAALPEGVSNISIRVADLAGNITTHDYAADTRGFRFRKDTTLPTGSIVINASATYSTSTVVTLTLTYSDATSGVHQVRYRNEGGTWTEWESPAPTRSWTLAPGDGLKQFIIK